MKIDLIDRNKYWKDLLYAYDDVSMELDVLDRQPSVSAIPIPKGATNGDMIMTMFPNAKIKKQNEMMIVVDVEDNGLPHSFWKDWWDAPYKKEVEE